MKISVLVVDDNEDLLFLLSRQLEAEGFAVTTCRYGKNFLVQLLKDKPQVVLLDIAMGSVTGIDLCEEVRSNGQTDSIRILLMSGNNDIAQIAQSCRADGYIRKPLDIHDIKSKIIAVLE